MVSLGVDGADVRHPVIKGTLEVIRAAALDPGRDLLEDGPEVLDRLMPTIDRFRELVPLKQPWYRVGEDFAELIRNDEAEVYSFGIEHTWLYERLDVVALGTDHMPLHARIGIGNHAGQASVEDMFLLSDAFYMLVSAESALAGLDSIGQRETRGKVRISNETYRRLANINLTVASYSRLGIVSFVSFMESFVNAVGHDFLVRHSDRLSERQRLTLQGRTNSGYMSLAQKLQAMPGIISGGSAHLPATDPKQRSQALDKVIVKYKGQRDSAVHYAPGKAPIWKRPHQWVADVAECCDLTLEAAREFWSACYPTEQYPEYLNFLEADNLRKKALKRFKDVTEASPKDGTST